MDIAHFDLHGCINGVPVSGSGRGSCIGGADRGTIRLQVDRAPLHWDPVLGLLAILDFELLRVAVAAGPGAGGEQADPIRLRRREEVLDENGREVGGSVISAVLAHTGAGEAACSVQYREADYRLDATERATSVAQASPAIAMPTGPSTSSLVSSVVFETDWGNGYRVLAVTEADLVAPVDGRGPLRAGAMGQNASGLPLVLPAVVGRCGGRGGYAPAPAKHE